MRKKFLNETISNYPYMKDILVDKVLLTNEEIKLYKKSEKLSINSNKLSLELLRNIIFDDELYKHLINTLDEGASRYKLYELVIGGDLRHYADVSISSLFLLLEKASKEGNIVFDGIYLKRYEYITKVTNMKNLKEVYKDKKRKFVIDKKEHDINLADLIDFLLLEDGEYEAFFTSENFEYESLSKEEFVYCAIKFLKWENINDKFDIDERTKKRIMDLMSYKKIDYQSINKFNDINYENINGINLDEELKKYLLMGTEEFDTLLEKSIYIYIKMCKTFTYDEEFYANNQSGISAINHEQIENLANITLENNKIVCYEFNAIYACLLNQLGLKYEIESNSMRGFGLGHANLTYKCEQYLVFADSVTSILNGDMLKAKLNLPLVGFRCENIFEKSKEEFTEILNKVYAKFKDNLSTEESIYLYELLFLEEVNVPFDDKVEILISKLKQSKLVGMDSISYLVYLRKKIFSKTENDINIKFSILRYNKIIGGKYVSTTCAIVTLSNTNIKDETENKYYLHDNNGDMFEISKEEIEYDLEIGILEYLNKDSRIIEGIQRRCSEK